MPHIDVIGSMFKHAEGALKAAGDLNIASRNAVLERSDVKVRKQMGVSRKPQTLPRKTPRGRG